MKQVYRRCAGLDVHQKSVAVCLRLMAGRKVEIEKAVFGTFAEDLKRLAAWLKEHRIRQIAMESTSVYWMPVWHVLEGAKGQFQLTLVNPQHVKALPGRKTDQMDCERLAELLQYGLLKGSFIPPAPVRELRDLTRRRTHIQQDRNRILNRIHRLLEAHNIKLHAVLRDLNGRTGRSILAGLATTKLKKIEALAELAQGSLRKKKEQLRMALRVEITEHFQFLLSELLEELDRLNGKLQQMEARITAKMMPYEEILGRLCTIPGIKRITAWTLVAEIGVDAAQFPDAAHLASWAGLCPGNSESAGKRHGARTRKGNRYLRRALAQTAWAISRRTDGGSLTLFFFRIVRRAGKKKAVMAVAHRVATIVYCMLRDGTTYRERICASNPEKKARSLVRRLRELGMEVQIRPRVSP